MSGRIARVVCSWLVAGLLTAGCGSQARWVNCEGQLEPINLPAPKSGDEPVPVDPANAKHTPP